MGWWFQGPYRRKMAHLWQANGLFHAIVFTPAGDQLPRGPFLTEDSAMAMLAEELTPKPKAS